MHTTTQATTTQATTLTTSEDARGAERLALSVLATYLPAGATTLRVNGMTCGHCERAITAEVTALPGVDGVAVDLPTGTVTVRTSAPVAVVDVAAAIDEAGYVLVR